MKYYFVHYWAQLAISGWSPYGEAINVHPFEYMTTAVQQWVDNSGINDIRLASWQEISEAEYKLYQKVNGYDD